MSTELTDFAGRLAALDSTVVSDALDGLGLPSGVGDISARWGSPSISGRVRTIELEPDRGGAPGPHIATSVVASARPGDVLVVANDGRTDVSCWGGLLSLGAVHKGVAGVIADGACRDVAEAEERGLPVFARAVSPRTARGRLRQKSAGQQISIDGVPVAEGDLVIADDSGIVFVPVSRAAEVITAAEQIRAREAAVAADIRAGVAIDQAMHDARLAGQAQRDEDGSMTTAPATPDAGVGLAGLPTAAVSDALDKLGLPGSLHGIAPLRPGQRACGPAFTVRYEPVDDQRGTVGDFLDDVPPGSVIVIDNDGRTDCTVWGGIMTRVAALKGIAGTVINGVCRDVEVTYSTGYRVWSAGRFMRTGKDRVRLRSVQVPVTIDGVTIHPGDVVSCDEDGVVIVPADRAADVANVATGIESVEARIVEAVRAGASLAEARRAQGYHSLQTPPRRGASA